VADLSKIFGGGFDPNSVEPAADFDVLPAGKYPVIIEAAELKTTKAGTGQYVALTMAVLDGPGKGRKLWANHNIFNSSERAQEIARKEFAALGRSIGVASISNTDQLLQQITVAHVKVKDDRNEVRTYSSIAKYQQEQLAAQAKQPQTPVQQPQAPVYVPPEAPVQQPAQPAAYVPPQQPVQPIQQPVQPAVQYPPPQPPAPAQPPAPPAAGGQPPWAR